MRRLVLLLAGLTALVAGVAVASFADATKAEMRWLLGRTASLARRAAVGTLVLALSLTPAGCLTGSGSERDESGTSYPYYSRDGTWVAFTSDRDGPSDVYVAPVGGPADRITDTDSGVGGGLAWSPDGTKIVFPALTGKEFPERTGSGLFVVDRDGSELRQLTRGDDSWPCWAADGRTIVFVRGDHIRAVDLDGTGGRLLVRNAGMPACSPTEPEIAIVVKASYGIAPGIEIGVLDLRSGSRRMLPAPRDATDYASPSWSPDGGGIVFEAQRERLPSDPVIEEGPWAVPWYFAELYRVDADGAGLRRLTENSVGDRWPDWLPDGRIFFISNRAGPDDLTSSEASQGYVMRSDGSHVQLFTWDPRYS